jgi:iron complex transport system ATP-binding protein
MMAALFRFCTQRGGVPPPPQQGAAVAGTMAGGLKAILADEPTASLDIAHQLRLMRAFRASTGTMTALLVLHDLNLAARFADRIALMDKGRIVLDGPPATVLDDPRIDAVFETPFDRTTTPAGRPQLVAR